MVAYQGGKRRIGKQIAGVINKYADERKLQQYLEPFFGCGGVTMHVTIPRRVVSDLNADLIQLWKELQSGTFPGMKNVDLTKIQFEKSKHSVQEASRPCSKRAVYGLLCSSAMLYMCTFLKNGLNGRTINEHVAHWLQHMENEAQSAFSAVEFHTGRAYHAWEPRTNWLIYLDPPYYKVRGYWNVEEQKRVKFDHEAFWRVASDWAKQGNHVFVSYNHSPLHEPEAWTLAWSKVSYKVCSKSKVVHERTEYLWFRGPTESQPMDAE